MSKVYVKTDGPIPDDYKDHITPGKVYEVDGTSTGGEVMFDDGNVYRIYIPESGHLDGEPWTLCDQHGNPVGEQKVCKCSLRTALVGDGCAVCNPSLAQEYAFMAASDRAAEAVAERDKYKALAGELAKALRDMHGGWKYIRDVHGDLYGVGWDRCDESAAAALAKYEQEKGV